MPQVMFTIDTTVLRTVSENENVELCQWPLLTL